MSTCPLCHDRGFLTVPRNPPERMFPSTRSCECKIDPMRKMMLRGIMPGLADVQPLPSTPLIDLHEQNLRITADPEVLKRHIRSVADIYGWRRTIRVVTDTELMSSWLGTASHFVRDADVVDHRSTQSDYLTLTERILPPDLLIVRVGVKSAANKEMANVLMETLLEREHEEKPTWVWDTPQHPLIEGSLCWSESVASHLKGWQALKLQAGAVRQTTRPTAPVAPTLPARDEEILAPDSAPAPASRRVVEDHGIVFHRDDSSKPKKRFR